MTIARELARRIKAFRYDDLPEAAIQWAKIGILDTVGVTLAGANEDCVNILKRVQGVGIGSDKGVAGGPCLAFGNWERVGPLDAVLINGTASHALDFDDFAVSIGGHPSVPLVPAIVALGEVTGASGTDAITAYVAGFEAESRFAHGVNFHHYEKGWHPTATLGIIGTVASSALLLDLNEAETEMALCLSASLASGIKANFGTMTKPLHVGHSARNGVQAALLAKEGFTAAADAFEHEQGFFNVFNGPGNFDADKIFENWADPLDIIDPGLGLKQFPCCGSTHTAINCMLEMVQGINLTPEDASEIEVLANPRRLPHTDNPNPQSGLEAKFSMHYIIARALRDGRVGLDHFESDAYAEPDVRATMSKVRVGSHPDMPADSDNQFGAEVIVTTTGGEKVSIRRDHELGRGPARPMSRDELWAKFEDCAKRALPAGKILPVFEMLQSLDDVSDINDLTRAIAPKTENEEKKVG